VQLTELPATRQRLLLKSPAVHAVECCPPKLRCLRCASTRSELEQTANRRRRMLTWLRKSDFEAYSYTITKLGLRDVYSPAVRAQQRNAQSTIRAPALNRMISCAVLHDECRSTPGSLAAPQCHS
jgi:hypothetical protein